MKVIVYKYNCTAFLQRPLPPSLMPCCKNSLNDSVTLKIVPTLRLVITPHLVETDNALLDLQMELVELKSDEQLLKKFDEKTDLLEV